MTVGDTGRAPLGAGGGSPGAQSGVRGSGWCPVSGPAGGGAGSTSGPGSEGLWAAWAGARCGVSPRLPRGGSCGPLFYQERSVQGVPVGRLQSAGAGGQCQRWVTRLPGGFSCVRGCLRVWFWPLVTIPVSSPLQTLCSRVAQDRAGLLRLRVWSGNPPAQGLRGALPPPRGTASPSSAQGRAAIAQGPSTPRRPEQVAEVEGLD